jgi:hypothetical protein
MAVARCELGVGEIDWVVAMCEGREPPRMLDKERWRIMRELKRAQRAAHESLAREQAHTRKMKAGFRTAPGKDTEVLDTGQRRR